VTERISRQQVEQIKREHVLRTVTYRPTEAAQLLGVSVRTFYRLVEEGLIATISIRPGQIRGLRCTALALEEYRRQVEGSM